MKTNKGLVLAIVVAGAMLLLQGPPRAVAQDSDPPGRVARLSYSDGSVSFQPGGEGDWVAAVPNRPLTAGDNLWADKDSRAELHIGSTAIRMDSETSVTFLGLDDHATQLKLSMGSIILRLRHLDDEDHFEVDTPNLAFTIQTPGEYRLTVNSDGNQTDVTVWHGRGEVTGGGSSYVVVADQRARFTGTDQLDHDIDQVPPADNFDNWSLDRDRREDHSESANYISPEVTGYEDLDDYGHWHYVADYGPVWTPVGVAAGWAPYRFGHWVWIAPWGWTWVEDEPWGFAPFHYGRWAYVENGWCWVPGPVVVRPVYAPALVAFVGGAGFHVGVAVGGPGVAWFPLAPREVYVPWYRTSPAYVNNVNITNTRVNVTQVTNVYNTTIINNNTRNVTRVTYVNQHVANAVTAVSRDTFANARPVARNLTPINEKEIAEAPIAHTIPVQPDKASMIGAGRTTTARPPETVANRGVVATRMPSPRQSSLGEGTNIRTETPAHPQETPRGNEAGKPQPSGTPTPQPEASRPVPRPGTAQEQGGPPSRQPQQERPDARPTPRPGTSGGYPNVKTAPPVQDRPEQQRNEESKFNRWQQQRQSVPPRPEPQRNQAPPPRQEKPEPHPDKPH